MTQQFFRSEVEVLDKLAPTQPCVSVLVDHKSKVPSQDAVDDLRADFSNLLFKGFLFVFDEVHLHFSPSAFVILFQDCFTSPVVLNCMDKLFLDAQESDGNFSYAYS